VQARELGGGDADGDDLQDAADLPATSVLADYLCAKAGRDLMPEEWKRFA